MSDDKNGGDSYNNGRKVLNPMRAPWLPPVDEKPRPAASIGTAAGFGGSGSAPNGLGGATPPTPPEPPRMPTAEAPAGPNRHTIRFTGSAGEFFRIWIVNVALTVVTLGLYSAWAKVRTKRYFYANTTLDGAPFDYLASPKTLFKGGMVAWILVVSATLVSNFSPLLGGLLWLALVAAIPWIVMRSLRFRARNMAWRNIRFGYDGTYGQAAYAYLLAPLTTVLTLGLSIPWADWVRRRMPYRGARFGTTPFEIGNLTGKFYRVYGVIALAVGVPSLALPFFMPAMPAPGTPPDPAVFEAIGLLTLATVPAVVIGNAYVKARTTNLIWNNLRLGAHTFACDLETLPLAWIYFSNTAAIVLSLGLATPWAKVRLAHYLLGHITVVAASDLATFAAEARDAEPTRAVGEELGEELDLEIAL